MPANRLGPSLSGTATVKACCQLRVLYRDGKHVQKNPTLAREWLEEGADDDSIRDRYKDGLKEAQFALGV